MQRFGGSSRHLALVYIFLLALLQHACAQEQPQSYESVMSVINTERRVHLDPSVQHIPSDPELSSLRPPPAHIPEKLDIFVGLSVFRDALRCGRTIFTGLKRATDPTRIYFGVVDQILPGENTCKGEYCAMAEAEWPDKGACPYWEQLQFDERNSDESRGPTYARHLQQKLITDQEFCLQLDGHSIFTNDWDKHIVQEWSRVDNEMAVLSTYLHDLHDYILPNGDNKPPRSLPHLCTTMRGSNGLVRNVGASMITEPKFPQLMALWGAGLSFNKCHAEKRVPVDSHTLWMFDGEEFLRSSRLWTHGYDIYSPSPLGSVVYHNYSKVPARFEKSNVDKQVKKHETEMGKNRFKLLTGMPFKGEVDAMELDMYGFGTARSLQDYLNYTGINLVTKNDSDSCEQLHWMPYRDPSSVEQVVGNGWTMRGGGAGEQVPTALTREEGSDSAQELTQNEQADEPFELHTEGNGEGPMDGLAKEEIAKNMEQEKEQEELEEHNKKVENENQGEDEEPTGTHAVAMEGEGANHEAQAETETNVPSEVASLRQTGQRLKTKATGNGPMILFLIALAGFVFIMVSNDSISVSLRRQMGARDELHYR